MALPAILLFSLLAVASARAATPVKGPSANGDAYGEFTDACITAFMASHDEAAAGNPDVEPGQGAAAAQELCRCTAKESRHEKVTTAALRREAARIRKDSKYKIQDPGLMNSFHYCAIQAMKEAEARERSQSAGAH